MHISSRSRVLSALVACSLAVTAAGCSSVVTGQAQLARSVAPTTDGGSDGDDVIPTDATSAEPSTSDEPADDPTATSEAATTPLRPVDPTDVTTEAPDTSEWDAPEKPIFDVADLPPVPDDDPVLQAASSDTLNWVGTLCVAYGALMEAVADENARSYSTVADQAAGVAHTYETMSVISGAAAEVLGELNVPDTSAALDLAGYVVFWLDRASLEFATGAASFRTEHFSTTVDINSAVAALENHVEEQAGGQLLTVIGQHADEELLDVMFALPACEDMVSG